MIISSIKNLIIDFLFPKTCFGCGKEGAYICDDCVAVIDISRYQYCLCSKPSRLIKGGKCHYCQNSRLDGLIAAVPYEVVLAKNIIHKYKYNPFIKALSKELAMIINGHLMLLDNPPDFSNFTITAIPLDPKRLKWRGYNQAEELAKALADILNLKTNFHLLKKVKTNLIQADLDKSQRKENIRGVFVCKNAKEVNEKNILIVDDVYTTGATMEEAAIVLKSAGAKKVWGIVFARD